MLGVAGLGLANVVPVLFRAAAGDSNGKGATLAVVSGVGYAGFLIGPPTIGFLAECAGVPRAMLLVVFGGLTLALGGRVLVGPRRMESSVEATDEAAGNTG